MPTKGDKLVKRSEAVLEMVLRHFPNSAFLDFSLKPELRKEIESLCTDLHGYEPKKPKKRVTKRPYPVHVPNGADMTVKAEKRAETLLNIKKEG